MFRFFSKSKKTLYLSNKSIRKKDISLKDKTNISLNITLVDNEVIDSDDSEDNEHYIDSVSNIKEGYNLTFYNAKSEEFKLMDRISDDTLNELFTQNNQKDVNRIDDIINSISIPSYPEI